MYFPLLTSPIPPFDALESRVPGWIARETHEPIIEVGGVVPVPVITTLVFFFASAHYISFCNCFSGARTQHAYVNTDTKRVTTLLP